MFMFIMLYHQKLLAQEAAFMFNITFIYFLMYIVYTFIFGYVLVHKDYKCEIFVGNSVSFVSRTFTNKKFLSNMQFHLTWLFPNAVVHNKLFFCLYKKKTPEFRNLNNFQNNKFSLLSLTNTSNSKTNVHTYVDYAVYVNMPQIFIMLCLSCGELYI